MAAAVPPAAVVTASFAAGDACAPGRAGDVRRAMAAGPRAARALARQFPCVVAPATGALTCNAPYAAAVTSGDGGRGGSAVVGFPPVDIPVLDLVASLNVGDLRPLGRPSSHGTLFWATGPGGVRMVVKVMPLTGVPPPVHDSALMDAFVAGAGSALVDQGTSTGFAAVYATVVGTYAGGPALALVMEAFQGGTVDTLVADALQARDGAALTSILLQTAAALHQLHALVGAVHNDTHLGNVLFTPCKGTWTVAVGSPARVLALPVTARVALVDFGRCAVQATAASEAVHRFADWDLRRPAADMAHFAALVVFVAARVGVPRLEFAPAWLRQLVTASLTCVSSNVPAAVAACAAVPPEAMGPADGTSCVERFVDALRGATARCTAVPPVRWLQAAAAQQHGSVSHSSGATQN
jgi:hypothetical protein